MNEKAISFGPKGKLVGVLSSPEPETKVDAPGVIILNAGMLHKVGPFRQSVDLARMLAMRGFTVLRVDLSYTGDSTISLDDEAQYDSVVDVKSSVDFLTKECSLESVVLMGLCSGSDNAHRAELQDNRVVGSVHIDGYGYRNTRYYLRYYGERLLSARVIRRHLVDLVCQQSKKQKQDSSDGLQGVAVPIDRGFPPIEQAKKEFSILVERCVRLLYIYTGGVEIYNNYKEQLRDTFFSVPFGDLLELEYYPLAEHTLQHESSRQVVNDRIVKWMREFCS